MHAEIELGEVLQMVQNNGYRQYYNNIDRFVVEVLDWTTFPGVSEIIGFRSMGWEGDLGPDQPSASL